MWNQGNHVGFGGRDVIWPTELSSARDAVVVI